MILNPYIIKEGEPVRQLFLQIPHIDHGQQAWTPNATGPTRVICLDILIKPDTMNILLGCPDWEPRGLANYVDVICSNLRMLIRAFGIIKQKSSVHWFQIIHTNKLSFRSFEFQQDDNIWLSDPQWREISIDDVPFNVDAYRILLP